ncbi:MAG TPA: RNA methyltransferase [Flavobacteriaceae bacterium]|nr:RNA methyltransferase [Flavobacteriaceae bacterium]
MHKKITSIQNPAIKKLLLLQEKSRARKKEGFFVVEGVRETELAIKGGYELQELFFCPELIAENQLFAQFTMTEISLEIYQKIAYRSSTEGIIAVAKTKTLALESLHFSSKNPLILIAEAPEKPGNIGALLRTADAANVDAVLIADPKTDLYNPNIVRSSVGGLFTNQIATGSSSEIIDFLNQKNVAIYAAVLQESIEYLEADFTGPSAIVVGPEATGLSQIWRENAVKNIHIPMQGEIDSMNVSVAAGILVFEARRQRGLHS